MEKKRSSFTGRVGFVLAAAGSAVGLGNLWRFPYLAAKYGGGIFLLVYIILAITFGFTLMVTEIAIGRKTGLSCISAYKKLDKRFGFMGWLSALVPVIITPYYCVIGGWVIRYFAEFVSGHGKDLATSSADFFSNFIGMKGGIVDNPMLWFIIFVALTSAVVIFGVEKGIEKVSKVMMPILVILCVVIAVFALTIDGALAGLKYYLLPDFSKFSSATVLGALGQLFYSMSLAMGIMITYGSYMKKEDNIEKSVRQIEIFDTGIALLAGLIIIPSVVAFNGGSADGINAGPGLMFITLPQVFNAMGSIGGVVGTPFRSRIIAVIIAFIINYAAYFSEIYRGGIESIPVGQYEAGQVLGLTKTQTFFKVVLFQVVKRIMAPMSNEVITLVKDTSLANVIAVGELIMSAQNIVKVYAIIWPLFYTAIFYLIFCGVLTLLFNALEKKLNYYRG